MPINVFEEKYFEAHIPHRINLLVTFRERYCPNRERCCHKNPHLEEDDIRDFYRCSKDISMLMVRFLLGELGIHLPPKEPNKEDEICPINSDEYKKKIKGLGITPLMVNDVTDDPRYKNILAVLKAANRAVAHINPDGVDHEVDSIILFDAIDFTEDMIKKKMYNKPERNYEEIMAFTGNNMHRKSKTVLIS